MLTHLTQPLKQGERFPLVLHFKETGRASVEVIVQATNATSASLDEHNHGGTKAHQSIQTKADDHNHDSPAVRIHLSIEGGEVASEHRAVRVTQGDIVELHFSSDEAYALHLHGYDIEVEVSPKLPAVLGLEATATGRFPVEVHGSSHYCVLIYLEVHPK